MIYALAVVIFALGLLTSVILHEAGHFLTAKAFGMKATKFFVGFGPTLWSRTKGETEYGVKAIPAGGFVKIIGMLPTEDVEPGDQGRAFYRFPLRKRVAVLAAGSTMHFIIAAFLLVGVAFYTPIDRGTSTTIRAVSSCVTYDYRASAAATPATGACGKDAVAAPAAAVLRAGDTVKAVDGTAVATYQALTQVIRSSPGKALTLTIVRAGTTQDVSLTPVSVLRNKADGNPGGDTVGAVGIEPREAFSPPSWSEAWHQAGTIFGTGPSSLLGGLGHAVSKVPDRYSAIFHNKSGNASLDGPQSVVGVAQISGSVFSDSSLPLSYRIWFLVSIVASVNFFVGVVNLLPFLPFDGGHIAASVFDRVRGRLRNRRGLPSISLANSYERYAVLSYPVFAVIMLGSLLVLVNNITNPIHL